MRLSQVVQSKRKAIRQREAQAMRSKEWYQKHREEVLAKKRLVPKEDKNSYARWRRLSEEDQLALLEQVRAEAMK